MVKTTCCSCRAPQVQFLIPILIGSKWGSSFGFHGDVHAHSTHTDKQAHLHKILGVEENVFHVLGIW